MLSNRVAVTALTALTPAIWGTTFLVTTELLPPDRPLLAALIRVLPAGLLLRGLAGGQQLQRRQGGFQLHRLVQKGRLIFQAPGGRGIQA